MPLRATDFESVASANSATEPAKEGILVAKTGDSSSDKRQSFQGLADLRQRNVSQGLAMGLFRRANGLQHHHLDISLPAGKVAAFVIQIQTCQEIGQ